MRAKARLCAQAAIVFWSSLAACAQTWNRDAHSTVLIKIFVVTYITLLAYLGFYFLSVPSFLHFAFEYAYTNQSYFCILSDANPF